MEDLKDYERDRSEVYGEYLNNVITIQDFHKMFSEETDRGCALLATSLLEHELKQSLKAMFVQNRTIIDRAFDFNGSLGTLSARIDMFYLLGMASKIDYDRMNGIKNIRNLFGHSREPIKFDDEKITQRINAISSDHHSPEDSPREKFIDIVSQALINIYAETYINQVPPAEKENHEIIPEEFISWIQEKRKEIHNK